MAQGCREDSGLRTSLMVLGKQPGQKNSLKGFGQCEVSKSVSPGCTGGLAWAVPPGPAGTGIAPTSEGTALPRRSLHAPALSGCPGSTAPQPRRALFLFYYYFFPDNTLASLRSQLTGGKVEDFHKNLNSSSCLSSNKIRILNLQYIHICIYV